MARKSKKFIAKKHKATVKRHKAVHKDSVVEEQTQNQESLQQPPQQAIPQTPVVESGFPPPTIQAYPQSQPIQPQPQSQVPKPTPPVPEPLPVNTSSTISNSNEINNLPSQEFVSEKKSKLWLFLIVGLVFLVGGSGALLYFREKTVRQGPKEEKVASTPTPDKLSPTQAPVTPTVSKATESANLKVDYLQYEIRVLNGSGIAGEAAKVKDSLEEEKFVVKDIDNADSSDYEKTVIKAKIDVPKEYLDKLKSVLEKIYVLDAEEELRESASVDVIIIIGSSKKP